MSISNINEENDNQNDNQNDYENYVEPVTNKVGGYKNQQDACGHSWGCKSCGYYYCANDEFLRCFSCKEIEFCLSCSEYKCLNKKYLYNLQYVCRHCRKEKELKKLKSEFTCTKCNRLKYMVSLKYTRDPDNNTVASISRFCVSCLNKENQYKVSENN